MSWLLFSDQASSVTASVVRGVGGLETLQCHGHGRRGEGDSSGCALESTRGCSVSNHFRVCLTVPFLMRQREWIFEKGRGGQRRSQNMTRSFIVRWRYGS